MRWTALLLVVVMACRHGRVVVQPRDVASHVVELNTDGRVELPAMKQKLSPSWSKSTTTIRKDQRVEVLVSNVTIGTEQFTGVLKESFGDLLADCPSTPFATDEASRKANPRCKLLGVGDASITVGRTTHPGPWFWGLVGAGVGFGTVACAFECGAPFSQLSAGAMIVGGVVAVVAVIGIASLISSR
jgi:hypothetical protein